MDKYYVPDEIIPLKSTPTRKQFLRIFLRTKNVVTYYDENCKHVQCSGKGENKDGASRSITDLLAIIRSRFPKTSFEGFVRILFEFMQEDKSVAMLFCRQVDRIVVKYQQNDNPTTKWVTNYSRREHYDREGEDGISFEKLEKIIKNLS